MRPKPQRAPGQRIHHNVCHGRTSCAVAGIRSYRGDAIRQQKRQNAIGTIERPNNSAHWKWMGALSPNASSVLLIHTEVTNGQGFANLMTQAVKSLGTLKSQAVECLAPWGRPISKFVIVKVCVKPGQKFWPACLWQLNSVSLWRLNKP